MKIERFEVNPFQENCYIVSDDSGEGIIIDCGAFYEEERKAVVEYVMDNGIELKHLISTHGHIDHNFGDKFVYDTWGVKPEAGTADDQLFKSMPEQAKAICGIDNLTQDDFVCVGKCLDEHDTVDFGSHKFTVLETPGHSPGGLTYYCEQERVAFTGDTLFQGSIGRTDFEGGSMFMMLMSLRHLSQLPDDVRVFPGHGAETTIGAEVASNPYIDR